MKSLIIFDNSKQEIEYFLPSLPSVGNNIHVLITSRYQEFDCLTEKICLSVWNELDAIKFIQLELTTFVSSSQQEIKRVCELLGYFPLASQQAVTLIKKD